MSKILRRPMFRGGPVDSRGTGITSGLMDGGRVGYQNGELVTGGDLISRGNMPLNLSNLANTRFSAGMPFAYNTTPINTTIPKVDETEEEEDKKVNVFDDLSYFAGDIDFDKPSGGPELSNIGKLNFGIIDREEFNKLEKEKADKAKISSQQIDTGDAGTEAENDANLAAANKIPEVTPNITQDTQEESTTIDPKQLMRENAELFRELLGEDNKKKLKDARIQDTSDYLLKFFEGTQKPGATVGSAAADVAAFATSRDSRTEKAKAAIDKQDQTAVALAINDYIAGKRSKEQLNALIAKSDLALSNKKAAIDYANKLTQGFDALPGFIADSKAIGYASQVIDGLRKSGLSQLPIERVTSKEMEENFEFNPETDTGTIFIETDTKTTYTFRSDGTKRIIDQG
jgi:hypothetical protein